MKSVRAKWKERVPRLGEFRNLCILVGKPEERDHIRKLSVDGRKILKGILKYGMIIRMIKSRKMRWAGHVERMGAKRNTCRILVGKPERKIPLERPRRRWVDNIKMDL
jgi:hypothetical protein